MRFPRHAKVFRGQIDAAPLASVFFLLVIFLFLNYSLVFVPGIMIDVQEPETAGKSVPIGIRINEAGRLVYKREENSFERFKERIKEEAILGKLPPVIYYQADPNASRQVVQDVRNFALENGIMLKRPGNSMDLPDAAGFSGEPGPVVVVTINLNGQMFYQHQLVREEKLLEHLKQAVNREGKTVKLVLQTDKEVPVEVVMRLGGIAREAGISKVVLAHKPNPLEPL